MAEHQSGEQKEGRKFSVSWTWIALILLSAAVIYYLYQMAEDRYASRAQFAVTRGSSISNSSNPLESILGGGSSNKDAYSAINYILSLDMLRALQEDGFDLRGHYSAAGKDFIYRLNVDASEQDLHEYYQERIDVHYDDIEGIVKIEVQAFEPKFAQEIAATILDMAATYLNETNRAIGMERMKFLLLELEEGERKMAEAGEKLLVFQNKNFIIDPETEAQAKLGLIHELKKQKVMLQAKILELEKRSPQSPAISEFQSQVDALEQGIRNERENLTGDSPDQMNQLSSEYSRLQLDLEFVTNQYQQTLAVAETVRVETMQASRFLTVIEHPFVPDEAQYPNRLNLAVSVIFIGFLAIQLINLLLKTILEHKE
ncbi:MAG: hypothetical protein AAGA96_10300 [Verrucomicrobiota bacterium]